ncbi:MAG: hypothetical protein J6T47_01955, partial [Lachnospiraceae bacterium]|nr:hypothetical protein [Lachnospiraceae bacterium]
MDKENARKIIKIASIAIGAVLFIALIVYLAVIGSRKPDYDAERISLAPSPEAITDEPTLPPDGIVVSEKTILDSGKEYYADLNDNGYYEQIRVSKRNLEYMKDIATLYINGNEVFHGDHIKEVVIENPFHWERGWLIGLAIEEEGLPEGYLRYRLYEYRGGDFFPINRDLERMEGVGGEPIPVIAKAAQISSKVPTFTWSDGNYDMMLYLNMPEVFFVPIAAEDVDILSFYIQNPRDQQTVYLHYAGGEWPTLKTSRVERYFKSFQAIYDKADITGTRRTVPSGQRYQIVKILFLDDISTIPSEWNGQQVWFQIALDDGTFGYILAQNLWRDMQIEGAPETSTEDAAVDGSEDASEDGSAEDGSGDASAEETETGYDSEDVTPEV